MPWKGMSFEIVTVSGVLRVIAADVKGKKWLYSNNDVRCMLLKV
jgi:hypothetical protein